MDSVSTTKSKKKKLFPCFRTAASSAGSFRGNDVQHNHVFSSMPVKGGGGALSRTLKAVLFGTSLAKKIRERKAKQKHNSNKENQRHQVSSGISSRSHINSDIHYRRSFGCSSRISAPFSSSYCSSSPLSEISDISLRVHPSASNRLFRQINRIKTCSGWFLLLVCLVSLISWGKIGAILCTSISILCFYLLRRIIGFRSPDYTARAAAMRSGVCRRRTVSEGFLIGDRTAARNSIFRVD